MPRRRRSPLRFAGQKQQQDVDRRQLRAVHRKCGRRVRIWIDGDLPNSHQRHDSRENLGDGDGDQHCLHMMTKQRLGEMPLQPMKVVRELKDLVQPGLQEEDRQQHRGYAMNEGDRIQKVLHHGGTVLDAAYGLRVVRDGWWPKKPRPIGARHRTSTDHRKPSSKGWRNRLPICGHPVMDSKAERLL